MLVVDAYPLDHPGRSLSGTATAVLEHQGHDVRLCDLAGSEFRPFMNAEERATYHDDDNIRCEQVQGCVDDVGWADALLFIYPTTTFAVPASLKGWLERVMLPGYAFTVGDHTVEPGLTNVNRIGVITSSPHGRLRTARCRDLGRRTILWTLRSNCGVRCRRSFLRVHPGPAGHDRVRRRLAHF